MNKKYQELYNLIVKTINNPEVETLPKMQNALSKAAEQLKAGEDYTRIAVGVSQAISDSYLANRQIIQSLKNVFKYVKPDADPEKLDSKTKREMGIITGYIRSPLNKDNLFD
ncbi:Hypothetical protein ADU72_1713 [Pediococcus damnosus]|uniref:Bacteriocin immunity protein n=1 Tax=Pediococcus damnosus TaxID=51663 RepID=A0A0R2H717_9LACO|nr:bacteriocin immunity protein [Pediococcus damnosus]AMV59943.1 Hypothetical protein ADU69_0265 [Pediococcus damnosus]AMV62498.1 Hypothetical protein ADU70_1004 [Pediococcus damnosus]AMV64187.1 Hypothetical protein ADU71_0264 [Pediococcus damnosus]AMV67638.1 Hypothetical protein ADU72_1713 [Pediococcus damnosus]AMV69033.1 Hypothetical protein ADU73_0625 [Pediococcus damnosus]